MTGEPEISDEELERRLRANGFLKRDTRQNLNDEVQRAAEKLMGRDNAERLAKHRPDGKRFRPTAVTVHYEYYCTPGSDYALGGWRINRVENGRPSQHCWDSFQNDIEAELEELRKKGFTVKRLEMEADRYEAAVQQKSARPESERRQVIDRLFGGWMRPTRRARG